MPWTYIPINTTSQYKADRDANSMLDLKRASAPAVVAVESLAPYTLRLAPEGEPVGSVASQMYVYTTNHTYSPAHLCFGDTSPPFTHRDLKTLTTAIAQGGNCRGLAHLQQRFLSGVANLMSVSPSPFTKALIGCRLTQSYLHPVPGQEASSDSSHPDQHTLQHC